jgi:hypothetical protein
MIEYDFNDPVLMGKAMKKICASKAMYYVDCDRMIRIQYNNKWIPYPEAVKIYPQEFSLD